MGRTKDERFMLCVYEVATQNGDLYNVLDRYHIGSRVGFNPRAVDNMCRLLAQANFIKILSNADICLTDNGAELVKSLLN